MCNVLFCKTQFFVVKRFMVLNIMTKYSESTKGGSNSKRLKIGLQIDDALRGAMAVPPPTDKPKPKKKVAKKATKRKKKT